MRVENAASDLLEPQLSAPEQGAGFALERPSLPFVAGVAVLLLLAVLLGLFVGRSSSSDAALQSVFFTMRAHRVAVAFLSGAALSVTGAIVQGLFRNPLASPTILGTTSGAVFGAHVALLVTVFAWGGGGVLNISPEMMVPIGAVLGAGLSLFVLLTVVTLRVSPLVLLLTGYALMMLFVGASATLTALTQEAWELNRAVSVLSMGNISAAGPRQLLLVLLMTLGGVLPALFSVRTLDVLLSGEEEASALGVDVARERFWLVMWVAIMTGGAVAVGGSVGAVGLIVPHAMRRFVGQRHGYLLPTSFVVGGTFVVLCDVLCRTLPARVELPLGILTDLIGAPVFLHMLVRFTRAESSHG